MLLGSYLKELEAHACMPIAMSFDLRSSTSPKAHPIRSYRKGNLNQDECKQNLKGWNLDRNQNLAGHHTTQKIYSCQGSY